MPLEPDICEKCFAKGKVQETGTASGRKHYCCPECGAQWREKHPGAVALGKLGGKATADKLTEEQRVERATKAGNAFWDKYKRLRQ